VFASHCCLIREEELQKRLHTGKYRKLENVWKKHLCIKIIKKIPMIGLPIPWRIPLKISDESLSENSITPIPSPKTN